MQNMMSDLFYSTLSKCHGARFDLILVLIAQLGNDIRKMDSVALSVVKNKDALAISQDALGIQAQRVWSGPGPNQALSSGRGTWRGQPATSSVAVAAPCNPARPTQVWMHDNSSGPGVLSTIDANGVKWCLKDVEGTEEVGSWRVVPCSGSDIVAGDIGTPVSLRQQVLGEHANTVAVTTRGGSHLAWENKLGASGPVKHSRYLWVDHSRNQASSWIRFSLPGAKPANATFRLVASDRSSVRNDDKVGGVALGGDWCLDTAEDGDSEVWAGPLAGKKWAVALLNRHASANSTIKVDYTMFNSTATANFAIRDVWNAIELGTHQGKRDLDGRVAACARVALTVPCCQR